jgi:hypothetical protein
MKWCRCEMREEVVRKARLAAALETWAMSRERAVSELSRKATRLARQGCATDAARFQFAARSLMVKAVHERARAAALRQAA